MQCRGPDKALYTTLNTLSGTFVIDKRRVLADNTESFG